MIVHQPTPTQRIVYLVGSFDHINPLLAAQIKKGYIPMLDTLNVDDHGMVELMLEYTGQKIVFNELKIIKAPSLEDLADELNKYVSLGWIRFQTSVIHPKAAYTIVGKPSRIVSAN